MKQSVAAKPGTLDPEYLRDLGKLYHFARYRYWYLLLIPALWILGGILTTFTVMDGLVAGLLIAWFFIVLFGVGAWVFLVNPEKEEVVRKYVAHVLPCLFRREDLDIQYFPSHDLSVKSLLRSGLYHDRYSAILREDCISGTTGRMNFGMYQVAVQTASSFGGARYSPRSRVLTNQFYGWAIHCVVPNVNGVHVILPRHRKTQHESDDWLEKVIENWMSNPKCLQLPTGYHAFDAVFVVYSDQPPAFHSFANKDFLDFLLYLQSGSHNAFGINISGNLFAMHMGHKTPTFRHCPDGDFASEFHPELLEDVKWFADLLKGIQRFKNTMI